MEAVSGVYHTCQLLQSEFHALNVSRLHKFVVVYQKVRLYRDYIVLVLSKDYLVILFQLTTATDSVNNE